MKLKYAVIVVPVFFAFFPPTQAWCIGGKDIVTLKKAGISDSTIHVIAQEKVLETCAFTVQEIVDLKQAGLKDETIQKLIKEDSFMRDSGPIVYGEDLKSIRHVSPKDLIKLKQAGLSDEVIRAVISGSRDLNSEEHRRAWEMLYNMGILMDHRERNEERTK